MANKKTRSSNSNLLEVQNAAKTLFANIRFQSVDSPIKSVLLTSTLPNEGKTVTAIQLAQAIATSGHRVLLVETDMRRRSLAHKLKLHSQYGIYAVLTGEAPLSKAVMNTDVPRMQFLDVEPSIPNPADLLSSKRMGELIRYLNTVYDYVIYDTPPVATFIDAAILSAQVDGTIIMVRPNYAKRSDLQMVYEQLKAAGANIIGICESFTQGGGSEYYYEYYTKGGRRSGREEAEAMPQENLSMPDGAMQELEGEPLDNQGDAYSPIAFDGVPESSENSVQPAESAPEAAPEAAEGSALPAARGSRAVGEER